MIVVAVFAALVAVALAAPQQGPTAQILKFDNENIGVDGYRFSFETSDPIKRDEEGTLQNAGSENEAISVQGQYTYTLPDGKTHTVTFVADENGYRPSTKTAKK